MIFCVRSFFTYFFTSHSPMVINAISIKENGIAIWNQENLQAMTDAEINSLVDEVFPPEEYGDAE